MSDVSIMMTPTLYDYLQKTSLRESTILNQLREKTHTLSMGHMQISPEHGQFMALLIELMGAQHILEIGTFTGYSTLWMAQAIPEQGTILTCDVNEEWTDIAKKYWELAGVAHKIKLKLAPAMEILNQLLEEDKANTFDFVFIDADKVNSLHYYEKALLLIRSGGLIVIDNVFQEGKVADLSCTTPNVTAIRDLNTHLLTDQRIQLSMLPLGDGITLARKK